MVTKILTKFFGTKHDREMKSLGPIVNTINSYEPELKKLSDSELQAKTPYFRELLANGTTVEELLPEAYAVCREAAWRTLGMRHYDVQLIGGIILNRGGIAEMKTGEGKTLVATLPMFLHGLTGKGAHLVTVNDYLARRDCEWMSRLYNWMGLTTGVVVHDITEEERKAAYKSDITYCTNNELGFDFLRDNMKYGLEDFVQQGHNFAIVDECDSVLIDEARTPLIISGPSEDSIDKYYEINKIIPHLKDEVHFKMEEKSKTVSLTEEGNSKVEELLGVGNIYDPQNIDLVHHIYQGLKAHHLFKKDVDYMIQKEEIVIVDEFTGRLMTGRRWSDGLHQAVEAKEGVRIKSENQTLATITFQNYFRMYNTLSGMTGTADTEAEEFKKIYKLGVSVIPTNKPIARQDHDDVVYKSEPAKFNAMIEQIKECHEKGQPVLVGTVSIERSERISTHLSKAGVKHNVLNAKHHEREADIIVQAGRKGAVTIATNMAGRGTDIVLGGNSEGLARLEVRDTSTPEYKEAVKKYSVLCAKEKAEVIEAGGLFIIGTERHESRRIDNQLRGRSGRQGDPGASRFYLSLDDDLLRIFNGERIKKIMTTLNVPEDEPITAGMVSRSIEGAQRKVEGHNFDIRKHLLEYDDVMNHQRNVIYGLRRQILMDNEVERVVLDLLEDVTSQVLDTFVNENKKSSEWDIEGLGTALEQQFGLRLTLPDQTQLTSDFITDAVGKAVKSAFDVQVEKLGEVYPQVRKMVLLQSIDDLWKEHLQNIDQLKDGINLRAFAQKDPLIEYKKEAFVAFEHMNQSLGSQVIEKLLKIQIISRSEQDLAFNRSYSEDSFEYAGSEESSENSFFEGFASQPPQQNLQFGGPSQGFNQDEGPKMNRADRRKMEKKGKKRR